MANETFYKHTDRWKQNAETKKEPNLWPEKDNEEQAGRLRYMAEILFTT